MAVKYIETAELHTFSCDGQITYIGGIDAENNEIVIEVCTYQLLQTLDIPYMKEKLNDYINKLNENKNEK
jgi:low affinity Fe/Cu permease